MKRSQTSKALFVQYLAGLAIATAPGVPVSAAPPPAQTSQIKVDFAQNLTAKVALAAPLPSAKPGGGPYRQTFGDLYVQTTFTEVQARSADGTGMLPSQAFDLIAKS
jgi:hypothetical protein